VSIVKTETSTTHESLDTRLEEMVLPESEVLEKLNIVSTAKRLANMVGIV